MQGMLRLSGLLALPTVTLLHPMGCYSMRVLAELSVYPAIKHGISTVFACWYIVYGNAFSEHGGLNIHSVSEYPAYLTIYLTDLH